MDALVVARVSIYLYLRAGGVPTRHIYLSIYLSHEWVRAAH